LKTRARSNFEAGEVFSEFFDEILHRDNSLELRRMSHNEP
jgi:hypothetical protein